MPRVGFGAAGLGNLFHAIPDEQARQTVSRALELGLNYFDTAPYYGFGLSEQRLGDALVPDAETASAIVSTKVGRRLEPLGRGVATTTQDGFVEAFPNAAVFDYSREAVFKSFEQSCGRLKRHRIDILLAHDLGRLTHGDEHEKRFDQFLEGGYLAMLELKRSGDIRALGLGVNECEICEEALDAAEFDCFLLAGRYTLLEQGAMDSLFPRCQKLGVPIICGGPFNSGILALGSRNSAHAHHNYGAVPKAVLERVERIEAVCSRHGVPLAAAALQFPVAHPVVTTVLPGLASAAQVSSCVDLLSRAIPQAFWDELRENELIRPDAPTPMSR